MMKKLAVSCWLLAVSVAMMTGATFAAELPAGYTAVEYFESTRGGGKFIDTGYTANGQTKVVMDAFVPARWEQNDRFGVLFGSRTMNAWATKAFALQMCDGNTAVDTVRFAYNGEYRQDGGKPFSFGERVTVTCDGQHVEWTGSKAASVDFTADPLASSKSTLYIFADNTVADDGAKSETGLNHSVMRLYSFVITEGGTLKRDFVPCVRLADAVVGLYDMVEGKFYGNSGSGNFATSASNLPFGRELASGAYEINESFAFAAPMGESALKIADGATVTLNIPAGVTIALRGGDAVGTTGAGAGIEVPANAKLYVIGEGALTTFGGKGANGGDGENGAAGYAPDGMLYSGAGGVGGFGGGGAGAGIGGRGGNGGNGGAGGASVSSQNEDVGGNSGSAGANGANGQSCGTIYMVEYVTVNANGGEAGNGGNGGAGGEWAWHQPFSFFGAWGGGGGGGGGNGAEAADIGGGGAGGAGGGGGGSGANFWKHYFSSLVRYPGFGAGGCGWRSDANGGCLNGTSYTDWEGTVWTLGDPAYAADYEKDVKPGAGGVAGVAGSAGANGTTAQLSSPATVNGKNVLTGSGDGWMYNPENNTVAIRKRGQYITTGDVTVDGAAASLYLVTLTGLPANATLTVTGLDGIESLKTNEGGEVYGFYLPDDSYDFTVGEGHFVFTVSGEAARSVAMYVVSVNFGAHITGVTYAVGAGSAITKSGTFTLPDVPSGTTVTLVDIACEEGYECFAARELTVGVSDATLGLTTERTAEFERVAYCGAEGAVFEATQVKSIYTHMDRTIGGGNWYAVSEDTTVETLTVSGAANLILMDGTTLTVNGGIRVGGENALNIYAQEAGTGTLIANGADGCAGIGGGAGWHSLRSDGSPGGSCGRVSVYGGVVAATGGSGGAGIGGGRGGDGSSGWDSGFPDEPLHLDGWNGGNGGTGGTVLVFGGTIRATGDGGGAGIGGGAGGSGGGGVWRRGNDGSPGNQGAEATVTLDDRVKVVEGAIGNGSKSVKIAEKVPMVTVGVLSHVAVAWTSGDGSVTNALEGASFTVPYGTENVKVFFTPDERYVVSRAEFDLPSPLTDDYALTDDDLPVVTCLDAVVTVGTFSRMTAVWTSGDGSETNAILGTFFVVEKGTLDVTVIFTPEKGYEFRDPSKSVYRIAGPIGADINLSSSVPVSDCMTDYVDESGVVRHIAVTRYDGGNTLAPNAWYVVRDSRTINGTITVSGTSENPTRLILEDGVSLTVKGGDENSGICIAGGASLVIYGQSGGTGSLSATGGKYAAGIGGGDYESMVGSLTVNGGRVTAKGGIRAAGIGGGDQGHGGTVTVNGGTVTATSGGGGAGIGGGERGNGGSVLISGGMVTADGAERQAAGIGGGWMGAAGTVTITGGAVTAKAAEGVATIGPGTDGEGKDDRIEISGGIFGMSIDPEWCATGLEVVDNLDPATKDAYPWTVRGLLTVTVDKIPAGASAAWTSGDGSEMNAISGTSFFISYGTANVKVIFSFDPAYELVSGELVCELGTVTENVTLADADYPSIVHRKTEYMDHRGILRTNDTFTLVTSETDTLGNGWYLVENKIERGGIEVRSWCTANLILADGASLAVQGGDRCDGIAIGEGGALNIFGQLHGSGSLLATGGSKGAGIGGGKVTINGGTVIAKGGQNAPGIDNGSPVTINGGTVTAMGGEGEVDSQGRANGGAGIGGGDGHDGGEVTVNGGTVTAFGSCGGAGIGGGFDGAGGTVSINGGTVSADGNDGGAAGIGGGRIFNGHERKDAGEVRLGTDVSVVDGNYGNDYSFVKISGPERVLPSCEGGTIAWSDAANAWVVAPTGGVTEVAVTGLPEGDFVAVPPSVTKVSGVADAQIKVRSGAYDITGAFTVSGGEIALDPNGSVMIGGEEIPVKPTIGDLDEGEPFMVDKGVVMVAVRAIPGLRYALVRGETVEAVCGGETPPPQRVICESVVATGARVALSDANPPEGGAFYVISVSCPAAVGPSDSTIRIVGGRVYSGQYDITDAVTIRGDGTVELKAGGVVGGVKVTPVIGELPPSSDSVDDATSQLFLGGPDGAALTLETIPGLCYGLLRGETPDRIDEVVDWGWAESGTMTLKDFTPSKDGAFYRIVAKLEEF